MADIDVIPRPIFAALSLRPLFFPKPVPLPDWQPRPEPTYNHIYVVRILDASPKNYQVEVCRLQPTANMTQGHLGQSHLTAAITAPPVFGASSGRNLDLTLNAKDGALVVFHLVDRDTRFVDVDADGDGRPDGDPSNGVVKAEGAADLIYQARWVEGSQADRKAISVILDGTPLGTPVKQIYGLGVSMMHAITGEYSDICIDPKIQNDGED